jgi:predicted transposase/invertase (TIGR01784 family)
MLYESIYADPMRDNVAKHLLSDSFIRKSFIEVFAGIKVESSQLLTDNLKTIDQYEALSHALKHFDQERAKRLKKAQFFQVLDENGKKHREGAVLLNWIDRNVGLLKKAIPRSSSNTVDILCKLQDGSFVTVEFQIDQGNFFMQRALYYLARVYQRQETGKNYDKLRPVIAINLIGRRNVTGWESKNFFKHFVFQDQCSDEKLNDLTLIQYSLSHFDEALRSSFDSFDFCFKEKDFDRERLKEWLKMFEGAPYLDHEVKSERYCDVNAAYTRIDNDNIERENPELVAIRRSIEKFYPKMTEEQKEECRQEGRQECEQQMLLKMVKKFLNQNKRDEEICDLLDINEEKFQEIKNTFIRNKTLCQ